MRLLPLLLILPVIELFVLIRVGSLIGALPTIALLIGAGFLGLAVLRRQGPAALARVSGRLQSGEQPAEVLADGALLAVAGILFLLPGLCSDLIGLPLLVPRLRGWLAGRLAARLDARMTNGDVRQVVIEGEYEARPADDAATSAALARRLQNFRDRP